MEKVNIRKYKLSAIAKRNQNSSIFQQAKKAAGFDNLHILITGETGTGKEVLANFIHHISNRADNPFVIANISAIPEQLIKGELFGYKKGSFTGAINDYEGLIKEANTGIIFLDEIGDIPLDAQVALLRFLDYGEIKTGGVSKPETVDVRVIAATNVNLHEKIEARQFREDLYNRLCGFPIHLEPLREKPISEIKETIDFLISDTAKSIGKDEIRLTEHAYEFLLNYEFKGNYREVRNIIERFYVLENNLLDVRDIAHLVNGKNNSSEVWKSNTIANEKNSEQETKQLSINDFTIDELIAIKVGTTLSNFNGVKSYAAKELNIDYKTLNKYLETYNSIGNIPNVIGINPTLNWKNSNSNFQKR